MTDPLGQSQVIPYLLGLSSKGYAITILSCEKKSSFEKKEKMIADLLKKAGIKWTPLIYHKSPPVLSTVYDIYVLKKKAKEICENENIKLIHCRSYISAFVGLWLKKEKGIPYIFDMRGFYADERVDGQLWNLNNLLYKIIYNYFKKKEKEFLREAGAIVTLTYAAKNIIESWGEDLKTKHIKVIPCSADFDFFKVPSTDTKKENRVKMGFDDRSLVVTYLGSLGTWYMLEEMLDFFKVLKEKISDAKFLILTPDRDASVYFLADKKGIDRRAIVVKFAERNDLVDCLSVSDLSMFFIKPAFSKLGSSPTKLGELLAMGIPVVCNEGIGDVDKIIAETKGGYVVKGFTQQEYERGVEEILLLKSTLTPVQIRDNAKAYFDLATAVNAYSDIYAQLS